jgi:predicted O-methyltransferase YrrM
LDSVGGDLNISQARLITGWMTEAELRWLAEQASTRKRIVEIGSWKGRSTRAMADNMTTDARIISVDTWRGSDEEVHKAELAKHPTDWLLQEFKRNLSGSHPVQIFQMTSLESASALRDVRFDMIFIDAGHDYESVKADILAWRPLLTEGGLFCGHDYPYAGVTPAVNEFIPNNRIGADTIWVAA